MEWWPWLIPVALLAWSFTNSRINKDIDRKNAERELEELRRRDEILNSKVCPFCAEVIKLAASICKECGSNVEDVRQEDNADHLQKVQVAKSQIRAIQNREQAAKNRGPFVIAITLISGMVFLAAILYSLDV